jgi:hypothetical protein
MEINLSSIDTAWMQHALRLAQRAEDEGEVPIGAVLIKKSFIFYNRLIIIDYCQMGGLGIFFCWLGSLV